MALPPAWKIKRELRRIEKQLERKVAPIKYVPRKVGHDLLWPLRVQQRPGQLSLGAKVAVLVVYQPDGVAPSTLFTLDHLAENGWSSIVVSNSELTDSDVEELEARSAFILNRENIGYDFGAYRDGLKFLWRSSHKPDRLVLLNDSTWFPLREGDQTLARMEALNADFSGHIFKIEDENNRARDHVESHLLMFSDQMCNSDDFQKFWKSYVMTDSRDETIEKGEKAISQFAIHSSFTKETLLDREKLVALLEDLEDDALLEVAKNTVHHLVDTRNKVGAMIEAAGSGKPWRQEFIDWVYLELSHSRHHLLSVTFFYAAMVHGGMGFVKKSSDLRFHLSRMKLLSMEQAGEIAPLHPDVRREVEAAVDAWVPSPNIEYQFQMRKLIDIKRDQNMRAV